MSSLTEGGGPLSSPRDVSIPDIQKAEQAHFFLRALFSMCEAFISRIQASNRHSAENIITQSLECDLQIPIQVGGQRPSCCSFVVFVSSLLGNVLSFEYFLSLLRGVSIAAIYFCNVAMVLKVSLGTM